MHRLTEQDRDSIAAVLDMLDAEIRDARLRGSEALSFVYDGMLNTLRKNVVGGLDAAAAS